MNAEEVRVKQLRDAYRGNHGSCVAFIDESYQAPNSVVHSRVPPFYLLTAFVVPAGDLDAMRADLLAIVGARYWHSTQAHRTDDGRARIAEFTGYIGEGSEAIVVALRSPIDADDRDGERARAMCFRELLGALADGRHCEIVSLVIFEERKFMHQRSADEKTVREARAAKVIPRTMRVLPASPTWERLLWLPDVTSFALYQRHVGMHAGYAEPFMRRVRVLEVNEASKPVTK